MAGFFTTLSPDRYPALLPSALLLAVLLTYASSLDNSFHYDDGHSILRNAHIRSLNNLPSFFSDPRLFSENVDYAMYRPMVLVLHAFNYAWGAYQPWGYLLVNLLIHALTTFLIFYLFQELGLACLAAFGGALLFALHPAQTEPINYISSRSESLAALFYLSAFLTYLKATRSNAIAAPCYGLSLVAFMLALLSKTTALSLPLLLLCHAWISAKNWTRLWPTHLPFWVISIVYFIIYQSLTPQSLERALQVRDFAAHLATQSKAFIHYLKLGFVPTHLNVHQQFFPSTSPLEVTPLASLALALSLLAGIVLLRPRLPLAAFGMAWFILALLPTFAVPLHILVNDHRLYLSLAGLALALATLTSTVQRREIIYLACGLLALLSIQRTSLWQSELTLWQDAVQRAPLMPEAHYNLGFAHHQAKNLEHARLAYEHAVRLSPTYVRALTNLGAIYREQGRLKAATRVLKSALATQPNAIEALNNLGLIYVQEGRYDEGIALYHQILDRHADLAETWLNLGLAYRDQGDMERAAPALLRAIQLKPELKNLFPVSR